MSRILEDRVWAAHPLAPAHRAALLYIAREVPDGLTEVLVNKTQVARALDCNAEVITKAVLFGETLGLCRSLHNGRIAFDAYANRLDETPTAVVAQPPSRGVIPVAPTAHETPIAPALAPQAVLALFGTVWRGRYGMLYKFKPGRDHKMAKDLVASGATEDEIKRAAAAYLADDDAFYVECAHNFTVFYGAFNKFAVAARGRVAKPAADAAVARIREAKERERVAETHR